MLYLLRSINLDLQRDYYYSLPRIKPFDPNGTVINEEVPVNFKRFHLSYGRRESTADAQLDNRLRY